MTITETAQRPRTAHIRRRIHRRLTPLYIGAFLEGVILWYAIERLFMTSIGFNDATVGVMIAAYSAVMLIAETPSGILADRGSRKAVLAIGFAFLALSSFLGGISQGPVFYIGVTLCWAVYHAMTSGTYDSIIYDTVLEESGDTGTFSRYYARYAGVDSVAQVIGALLGGLAAALLTPRGVYFLSIPLAVIGLVAILRFREPTLHRAKVAEPIREHVTTTIRGLRGGADSTLVLAVLLLQKAVLYVALFGFAQLWLVELDVAAGYYGPAYAAICVTGLTGALLMRIPLHRTHIMSAVLIALAIACVGLATVRDPIAVVACQMLLGTGLVSIGIVFTQYLHDYLDSTVRAGASSALSTLNRCLIIPLSLVIGHVSHQHTIFSAGWLLLALLLPLAALILRTLQRRAASRPAWGRPTAPTA